MNIFVFDYNAKGSSTAIRISDIYMQVYRQMHWIVREREIIVKFC